MDTSTVRSVRTGAIAAVLIASALTASGGQAMAAAPGGAAIAPLPPAHARGAPGPAATAKLVDINSAGRAELKSLPGIGDAEAQRIIAGRPYLSKAELVTKKVMPTGPYLSLKDRIVAMPKNKPNRGPQR